MPTGVTLTAKPPGRWLSMPIITVVKPALPALRIQSLSSKRTIKVVRMLAGNLHVLPGRDG